MKSSPISYHSVEINTAMQVEELFNVHYFEHFRDYPFVGEKHDFWEIVYVDDGELVVSGDQFSKPMRLGHGQMLLIPPNVFHTFQFGSQPYIDMFSAAFRVNDPAMEQFVSNPILRVSHAQRELIFQIIAEARRSFLLPLSEVQLDSVIRLRDNAPFGSLRMIQNDLECLLILMLRSLSSPVRNTDPHAHQRCVECVKRTMTYLKNNLYNPICMEDVCSHVGLCASSLQKEFSQRYGHTVMNYLAFLRVEEAKFLIRQQDRTFTEIADQLCFCSVHHFSRRFKQITGQSPSEYAKSLSLLTDLDIDMISPD